MRRIVIAIGFSGLLAACGQQAPAAGEAGAPAAELDYIDAVPIDKNTPPRVAQPEPAAKKEEPETTPDPAVDGATAEATTEVEVTPEPARIVPPEPVARIDEATAATRRANESNATPYLSTPRPN